MRRAAAMGVALFGLTGCVHDLWEGASPRNREIKSPLTTKQTAEQHQIAERVNTLGRRILDQNTFTGIEPVFHLVGVKELMLFHRGSEELFISAGLVAKCKIDEALAAVLCTELGRMVGEKRASVAVGRDNDPIARNATIDDVPGAVAVGTESQPDRKPKGKLETDGAKLAAELMRGAGFDPVELERIEPILKDAERHDAIRKQMVESAPVPEWKK